jgi:hypothetical protein
LTSEEEEEERKKEEDYSSEILLWYHVEIGDRSSVPELTVRRRAEGTPANIHEV